MWKREDHHLPIVQAHIAAQLGRPLRRVPERSGEGPTHDLETCDGQAPEIAIEVKELVPSAFLKARDHVSRDPGLDSKVLTKRWSVVVFEEPLAGRLAPIPSFPNDPPAEAIAAYARAGWAFSTKAERQERWRREHTLDERPPRVPIRGLAKSIEPALAVLERLGIMETRSYDLQSNEAADDRAAREAIWFIECRTNDAICMARDPSDGENPGIDLHFGYGEIRTGRPDVVAERVQMWLDSNESANLIDSLEGSGADEKHGALWLSTDVESQSAHEQGVEFCPTLGLRLPPGLDVLWVFLGPLALRYDGSWVVTPLVRAG